MMKPVQMREFFLIQGNKLVLLPTTQLQRIVRQMIKSSKVRATSRRRRSPQG